MVCGDACCMPVPCPPTLPCSGTCHRNLAMGQRCCQSCPPPCPCRPMCCPAPCPCTPCPPCRCEPRVRKCPTPRCPDIIGPMPPVLPPRRPRRPPSCCPIPPPDKPVCWCPVLPRPPPKYCEPLPIPRCPEPVLCVRPVLPCSNPQCPPPCLPKQSPICPRPPPPCFPCIPVKASGDPCDPCCTCPEHIEARRRPLIAHDSVYERRPTTGLPGQTYLSPDPKVRYVLNEYYKQGAQSGCCYNVCVPLH